MHKLFFLLGLLLSLMPSSAPAQSSTHLTLPKPGSLEPLETSRYFEQLLLLALTKTAQPNEQITLDYFPIFAARERLRTHIAKGDLDILWSSSSPAREEYLLAIKFNLMKSVNEYRRLLIRAEDTRRFDQVDNLPALRKFRIGTGTHWSDTQVYSFNAMNPVTSFNYESMFKMLAIKRFDYMARSLQEVTLEYEKHKDLGLIIDQGILLHYPQPIYFFIKKNKRELAERILDGLKMAQADGSLDTLFFNTPSLKEAWEELHKSHYRLIELQLPPEMSDSLKEESSSLSTTSLGST